MFIVRVNDVDDDVVVDNIRSFSAYKVFLAFCRDTWHIQCKACRKTVAFKTCCD